MGERGVEVGRVRQVGTVKRVTVKHGGRNNVTLAGAVRFIRTKYAISNSSRMSSFGGIGRPRSRPEQNSGAELFPPGAGV